MVVNETYIDFNEIIWHDCVVKSIEIDRYNPGEGDSIKLLVMLPDSNSIDLLVFDNIYWANFNLNFGVIAEETIYKAYEKSDGCDEFINLISIWGSQIDTTDLVLNSFEFNSSGSKILIVKKGKGLKRIINVNITLKKS